mmetsp:Transcript_3490/g.10819  ORF Transcript_3490/g.10819 Transcript_3490/m.10819 type:complete len:295 (+) Transcript_3490:916-1800(+)
MHEQTVVEKLFPHRLVDWLQSFHSRLHLGWDHRFNTGHNAAAGPLIAKAVLGSVGIFAVILIAAIGFGHLTDLNRHGGLATGRTVLVFELMGEKRSGLSNSSDFLRFGAQHLHFCLARVNAIIHLCIEIQLTWSSLAAELIHLTSTRATEIVHFFGKSRVVFIFDRKVAWSKNNDRGVLMRGDHIGVRIGTRGTQNNTIHQLHRNLSSRLCSSCHQGIIVSRRRPKTRVDKHTGRSQGRHCRSTHCPLCCRTCIAQRTRDPVTPRTTAGTLQHICAVKVRRCTHLEFELALSRN